MKKGKTYEYLYNTNGKGNLYEDEGGEISIYYKLEKKERETE